MIEIILDLLAVAIFFFILKYIFRRRIYPYDSKFWSVVQTIWLIASFSGFSLGLYEIHRLKVQSAYVEEEEKIMAEFEDIKINLYEQVQLMQPDNTVGDNVKESIRWFHTVATLLEEGYKSDKWKKFISYTRGFVFNEPGYTHLTHDNVLLFDWPKDENLQPADIVYKTEMRQEVDKLIKLQADAEKLKEDKPNNKPEFFIRYIFIFYFTVALALKLLRTYAEYFK